MNEKIKFPFINNIDDIIDQKILEIIIRGYCEEIGQAIVFIEKIPPFDTIPHDKNLIDYCGVDCANFINNEECIKIRTEESKNYKLHKEKITFYLCKNGAGGLHLEYPVFIDGKFCGLLVSGTARFNLNYDRDTIIRDINKLNYSFHNNINDFLSKYKLIWFDKNNRNGVNVTYSLIIDKKNSFSNNSIKLESLLNEVYTGKIRNNNRYSIKEIFNCLSKNYLKSPVIYGESSYKRHFYEVLKLLKDIIPVNNITIYDNFILDKGPNMLTANVKLLDNNSKNREITITPKIFDRYFQDEIIFYWEPKNQFLKTKYDEDEKINRALLYDFICEQIEARPDFLVLLPMIVHRNRDREQKVIIIFYDLEKKVPYGSENLYYYFKRLYDIFRFVIINYYDQIKKEKYLQRISHDSKGKAGILYSKAEDTMRLLKFMNQYEVRKKLEDIKTASANLINLSSSLDKLARSDYDYFVLFENTKINFYEDIYKPLFFNYKYMIEKKNLYFDSDSIEIISTFYSNFHFLYRIVENLFTNIIKYSLPSSQIGVSCIEESKKNEYVTILFSNVTIKLNDKELQQIVNDKYRGSNVEQLRGTYSNIPLEKGRGLGLKIVKELLISMKSDSKIYQSPITDNDKIKLSSSPDFFNYDIRNLARFNIEIIIYKQKSEENIK